MPASATAGLYVHVPFCSAICPYCDFAVKTVRDGETLSFVEAVCQEIALWNEWSTSIDTVYLGGGTPSLLDPTLLAKLLEQARDRLPIAADAKVFMEANPEDVTAPLLDAWSTMGVSTLSLGVQSFVDVELRSLGRRHDASSAERAVDQALAAGFETVSVDLIFGLPGQDTRTLNASLDVVERLRPMHISGYQLTIHQGTTFARWRERGKLVELGEQAQWELFDHLHQRLADMGLHAYEVSNFSRGSQHRSEHNQKYWRHAPYLGIGPSAHSFDGHRRWWNHATLTTYLTAVGDGQRPLADTEELTRDQLALERVMLGLRTTDGVDLAALSADLDVDLIALNRTLINNLVEEGVLGLHQSWLRPSRRGLAQADGIAQALDLHSV